MKSLLEYLNRKSQKSLNYDPVTIHYHNGKTDGVEISSDGMDFVLSLKSEGQMRWNEAMDLAQKQGDRLGTKEEWKLIHQYRDQINQLLDSVKGDNIIRSDWSADAVYWTSDECDSNAAWNYDGYIGRLCSYKKSGVFTVRTVKDI